MAIVRLAPPFDAFHGTISGLSGDSRLTTFSSAKSAGVSRKWTVPANPQTTNQMLIRGYQIAAAAGYKALTTVKAALWIAAAEQIQRENILHLTYTLSGINLYCMINVYRLIDGTTLLNDVPAIIPPPIPTGLTSIKLTIATTVTVIATVPGLEATGKGFCRISAPLPSANYKALPNQVRMGLNPEEHIEPHIAQSITWTIDVLTGTYIVGDRVGVMFTPLSAAYFPGTPLLIPNVAIAAP